ncbi:MAG TPA: TetR/AcrR family transcriptional regulator [Trebonia sp.]|nr:TetR/AcrR family transcriptional regulator [Trebonia sp.]
MTTPPRRLAPGDRRRQILSMARELLDFKSLDDITVEEAAERAGVSPGLVFHYFGTQRKFRRAIAEEVAQELLVQLAPDPALSHVEQLRGALDRFTDYVAKRPELFLAVTRVAGASQDLRDLHAAIRSTLADWLVEALCDVGVDDTPALHATISGWIAYTEEVVLDWLTGQTLARLEVVSLCESACYHLVQAVVGDEERWRRIAAGLARRPGAPTTRRKPAAPDTTVRE